jgi:hypothetical protein
MSTASYEILHLGVKLSNDRIRRMMKENESEDGPASSTLGRMSRRLPANRIA